MAKFVDLTGQRFGKLTVIERVENGKNGEAKWLCKCDCGNVSIVYSSNLLRNKTQSCGCNAACKPYNLAGMKFGKLTVIALANKSNLAGRCWVCTCDCGNTSIVDTTSLVKGHSKSCGCLRIELGKETFKHNLSNSRLYKVWCSMKARCYNPQNNRYQFYGGLGITICDEWKDFENFHKWAMETGYDENAPRGQCTIDRIDVDGNYEPSNCRWADAKTQNANKRKKKDTTPAD